MSKQTYGKEVHIEGHTLSLSMATEAAGFVFVSGLISADQDFKPLIDCGIEEQTRNSLNLIKATLEEADCTMDDVVNMKVILTRREDFDGYNKAVREFFSEGQEPSRTTTLGELLLEGALCEIDAVAYKG